MSVNKIIIGFIIILLIFSGIVLYRINQTPAPKSKVIIDNQTFSVKVATTSAQQEQGLSGTASLPQDQGMLFVFPSAERYPFWMKNMKFPLDIVFINNNKVVSITQNVPAPKNTNEKLPIYTPDAPANQVLEINAGLAKKYNFKKDDAVSITISQ